MCGLLYCLGFLMCFHAYCMRSPKRNESESHVLVCLMQWREVFEKLLLFWILTECLCQEELEVENESCHLNDLACVILILLILMVNCYGPFLICFVYTDLPVQLWMCLGAGKYFYTFHSQFCIQSCQYRCEYVWVQKDTFIHSILCPLYRIVSTGVNVFGCRKMHLYTSFPVLCT